MSKNNPHPLLFLIVIILIQIKPILASQTIILDVGPLNYEKLKTSAKVTKKQLELESTFTTEQSLQQQNQIVVNKNAGVGRYSTVFLQGSQSSQILNLKNNFRNSDPSLPSRVFNYGDSLHGLTDSIRVIQGPESIEFGTDALAGVIHMKHSFAAQKSYRADLMFGSFNTTQLKLQSQGPRLEWAATGLYSEGISEVEGEDNEADASKLSQLEAAYKSNNGGVFRLSVSDKKSDLDDYVTGPQDDPNYYTKDKSYHINWQKKFLQHYFVGASFQQFNRHAINQPDSESSKVIDENYKAQSHQVYLKAKNIKDFLNFGVDYFNEVAELPSLKNKKSQQHYGVWTKLNFKTFKNHELNLGLRYFDIKNTQGVVYQSEYLIQLNSFAVWTRLSTGFKAASLSDLYTPSIGNSSLNDEKNNYYELGTSYQTSFSLIKFLYFKNNYRDLIQFKQNEGLLNIGKAKIEGVELSSVSMIGTYQLTAFMNYWDSINVATDKRLTLRPEWVLGLGLERSYTNFKYQILGKYIGDRFDFADNKLDAYFRWDLYFKYQINKSLNSYFNILNAFEANSKWAVGYSSQPRELYIGLSYSF